MDRAKNWAAFFPFQIKDIPRTFFEIEGAARMEEEFLPCLCYVLKNLYHLGARENTVVRETERGIIDEGTHKATVVLRWGIKGHSFGNEEIKGVHQKDNKRKPRGWGGSTSLSSAE